MVYNSHIIKDTDGTEINFLIAKSKCRTMHITINSEGIVKAVCPKFVSDEKFEEFLYSKLSWVRKSLEKIKCNAVNDIHEAKISTIELKNKIFKYIDYYKYVFLTKCGYNINPKVVKFGKSKTQWGSCTKEPLFNSGIVRFSIELCKCNDAFIEAVVVHELCHLVYANHSKRFWNLVNKLIHNYKERNNNKYY